MELLASMPADLPLLGVCLGHQALVVDAGGQLEIDRAPVHGKASAVSHNERGLFEGLPNPFECGRYHSLRAEAQSLPDCLERTAWTADDLIMGVRHKHLPRHGVQFHPESILSPLGPLVLANFLRLVGYTIEPAAMQRALAAVSQEPAR